MATYYLAFDVGIKNLAYCFAKYDKELTIIDWNIINFSKESLICNQLNIKKNTCKKCTKKAIYINKNKTNSYCDVHHKIKNEKVTKIQKPTLLFNIEQLLMALEKLYDNILTIPYDICNYANKINVLIENQPVFLIPTMKTYSIVIYSFFANKKIHNTKIINDVRFINAITKTGNIFVEKVNKNLITNFDLFSVFKKKYIEKYKDKKKIKAYDIRKDFSIEFSQNIITKIPVNCDNIIAITKFDLEKKKR
jgi:hypothetical protein